MDYEQRYKEALERAKGLLEGMKEGNYNALEDDIIDIFPELKESKDERIRKVIYGWIYTRPSQFFDYGFSKEEMLAWVEKQGEQKSVDKTTPMFKVGDWIVQENIGVYKVIEVCESWYEVVDNKDKHYSISFDKEYMCHLWTIQDAKDGDVLMTTKIRNCPFIYRKTDYNNNLAYYYAGVDGNGDFCEGCLKRTMYHFGSVADITPATKEQRNLLFQKMKEAGYEWDADKKELKEIGAKTLDANKVIEWLKSKKGGEE